jgi:SAM-dependent methyltransferase
MTIHVDHDQWRDAAQQYERAHWHAADQRHYGRRTPQRYDAVRRSALDCSRKIWERLGVAGDWFAGRRVIDLGPGPTARCLALEGFFVGIDPLADFYKTLWWSMLDHYERLYSQPAEMFLPELVNSADAIVSLNCLDHCYDLTAVLHNAFRYLRLGGEAILSFDVDRRHLDPGHPIQVTHDEATRLIERAGFRVERRECGRAFPDAGGWRDNWGEGIAWHWWLTK